MMRRYRTGLWSNPDFVKLWLGQTVSYFGSGITGIALSLTAVLVLAATPAQMGLLGALDGASVLVIGLLAGVWVDRIRRRPLLIATDLGRAFVLSTIPLAALLGVLRLGQLYIVAALAGMLTVIFNVAHSAFLPSLIPQESLVEANSKLAMSDSLAEIGGPAVAGPLVQLISAPFALLFDALSFLFSACCLVFIHTPEPPPVALEQRKSIWSDLVEGLRLVLKNPLLRALAGSAGTFNLFGNFIGALYALFVIRQLGVSPIFLGLLIATGGVSALVGALMAERVVRRFGLGRTVGMGLFMYGATGLLIPLAGGSVALALSLLFLSQLLGDASVSIYFIAEVSLRQSIVPANVLGRTNASMQFLSQGVARRHTWRNDWTAVHHSHRSARRDASRHMVTALTCTESVRDVGQIFGIDHSLPCFDSLVRKNRQYIFVAKLSNQTYREGLRPCWQTSISATISRRRI